MKKSTENCFNKKRIGIVGWSTGENSFGVTKPYLNHISRFGTPVILSPNEEIDHTLDLVILPGGRDTFSFNYGEPPGYFNSDPDQYKEYFLWKNVPQYIEAGIPIFGTCLGFQQLIVMYGGILTQDIDLISHGYSSEYRSELVHRLIFNEDSQWKKWEETYLSGIKRKKQDTKKSYIRSCSLHHQGVYEENMPDDLEIICTTHDGIVEAFIHTELPIAGCQFHVEEDNCPLANAIIVELLKEKNKSYDKQLKKVEVED